MKKLISEITKYIPANEQEAADRLLILDWLKSGKNILTRDNQTAHLTASAWVVNPDRNRVLMAYHNIYDSWAWLGGHADGNPALLDVALKEAREESGIQAVRPVSKDILSLESLCVNGHEKKGAYIPSHLHLNATYLLEADPEAALISKPDENRAVGWIPVNEISKKSSEPWFIEKIYAKLIDKTAFYQSGLS